MKIGYIPRMTNTQYIVVPDTNAVTRRWAIARLTPRTREIVESGFSTRKAAWDYIQREYASV